MKPTNNNHKPKSLQRRITPAAWLALTLTAGAIQAQTLPALPVSPAPVVNYEYDAQGNPTKLIQAPGVAGLGLTSSTSYDNLYRVKDATDAKAGITRFNYDGQDRLTKVTDPRTLVTEYPRNGLGDATQLKSPDTGNAAHTFDAAGNLKTRLDARGVLSTYTYDVLNRPTSLVYSKAGFTSETHTWTYDQSGPDYGAGIGRLGRTDHPHGATRYIYDPQGRITSDFQRFNAATGANPAQVVKTVGYTYDAAGNVTSLLYPSGRKLTIGYSAGAASSIGLAKDATSAATNLVSGIQWEPFGPVKAWNWQMASSTKAQSWSYDSSGRLIRYRLADLIRDVSFDAADRITGYKHYDANTGGTKNAYNQAFGYDELGRITSVTVGTSTWSIGYDANGNRTSMTLNGTAGGYTTPSTSNRLASTTNPARTVGYDTVGNITSYTGDAASQFGNTPNLANRMVTLTKGGVTTTYAYDTEGRRIRKYISSGTGAGAASTVLFVYDLQGQLLGEYDSTGKAIREYVWFNNTPIAIFTPDPANAANPPIVYYIQTDHLNTPRVVFDKANKVRWLWLAEPFGTTAPETNPSGLGAFTQPLRFPGQYADQESGLFYNWNRYYDPATGRYITSDPIGLKGGLNTYGYAGGNPARFTDALGLFITSVDAACMQNPQLCADLFGDIIKSAAALSGDQCLQEDAERIANTVQAAGNVLAVGGLGRQVAKAAKRTSGSPALKGDPYHPESVAARQRAGQSAYGGLDSQALAASFGYGTRIPPQKAPFKSHGQPVFSNGRGYISPDIDAHNVTNGWKMFDAKGRRTGTWNSDLSERLKD